MVVACSVCGTAEPDRADDDPPLGWSSDTIESGAGPHVRWVCVECTRRYVRSIEAKLDRDWW